VKCPLGINVGDWLAVRLALGASRGQIISQLLVESLLLSMAGGLAGLLLAVWIDETLVNFLPAGATNTLAISASPDWRILRFTLGISLATGIIFGLVPALQATRPDLAPTLKDEVGAIASTSSIGLRKTLVVAGFSEASQRLLVPGARTASEKSTTLPINVQGSVSWWPRVTPYNRQPNRRHKMTAKLTRSCMPVPRDICFRAKDATTCAIRPERPVHPGGDG